MQCFQIDKKLVISKIMTFNLNTIRSMKSKMSYSFLTHKIDCCNSSYKWRSSTGIRNYLQSHTSQILIIGGDMASFGLALSRVVLLYSISMGLDNYSEKRESQSLLCQQHSRDCVHRLQIGRMDIC